MGIDNTFYEHCNKDEVKKEEGSRQQFNCEACQQREQIKREQELNLNDLKKRLYDLETRVAFLIHIHNEED